MGGLLDLPSFVGQSQSLIDISNVITEDKDQNISRD